MNRCLPLLVTCALLSGCIAEIGGAPPPPADQERTLAGAPVNGGVQFISFPAQKSITTPSSWGKVLADIEQHIPSQYGTTYRDSSYTTWGHETTHGINSHIRNYHNKTGKKANGFYVLDSRGVVLEEPAMSKSKVAAFVPQALRGYRFSLYITGQTAWDDTPLYIFDEYVAYDNGAAVGVDLVERGLWTSSWQDGVSGALEFTIYAVATAMAIKQHVPQYFQTYTPFREFLAWEMRRAMTLYRKGAVMSQFKWDKQDAQLKALTTDSSAKPMRDFIVQTFGQTFYDQVILGQAGPGTPGPGTPGPGTPDSGTPGPGTPDSGPSSPGPSNPSIPGGPPPHLDPDGDDDGDGIKNGQDLCSWTTKGQPVWTYGAWIGCASGQLKDTEDHDRDRVRNAQDRCSGTPLGATVWFSGAWMGCAAGQTTDS